MILPLARRISATFGLIALIPVAMMMAKNLLTPIEASLRAVAILVATKLMERTLSWSMLHALKMWAHEPVTKQELPKSEPDPSF